MRRLAERLPKEELSALCGALRKQAAPFSQLWEAQEERAAEDNRAFQI